VAERTVARRLAGWDRAVIALLVVFLVVAALTVDNFATGRNLSFLVLDLAPILLGSREPDFFEACALGRTDRAAGLIAIDATLVNAHAPDGFTGLGLACFFRHIDTARLLLDHGADPSLASSNALHLAPLHSAVAADSLELVDLLLTRGAEPNPSEASGATPLHSAAGHGNGAVIERLLAAGADRTARTKDGKTPADTAKKYNKPWAW